MDKHPLDDGDKFCATMFRESSRHKNLGKDRYQASQSLIVNCLLSNQQLFYMVIELNERNLVNWCVALTCTHLNSPTHNGGKWMMTCWVFFFFHHLSSKFWLSIIWCTIIGEISILPKGFWMGQLEAFSF